MNPSAFDLSHQNQSVDAKIVAGLERLAEAFRVLLWQQSRATGLSPIQLQVLVFLLHHPERPATVSYLALEFNMTKPTMSDAVKILLQKSLAVRQSDPTDSRSYHLILTEAGRATAQQASSFAQALEQAIATLEPAAKTVMFDSLYAVINILRAQHLITVQRMCKTCVHYGFDGQIHFCNLLRIPLEADYLRLDCPEHQQAV